MNTGKQLRMASWLKNGRSFILAVDQMIPRGIAAPLLGGMPPWTHGPWDGLVVHPGMVKAYADDFAGGVPFLLKLTSNSRRCQDTTRRGMIASVEQGLYLGAAGVALNLFIGSRYEAEHLRQLSETAELCDRWGMPLMVFANPADSASQFSPEEVAYACRIAAELGADVVKTDYTGDPEGFAQVARACPVPLLVEESPLEDSPQGTLAMTEGALAAGGAGVLLGQRGTKEPQGAGRRNI